MHNRRFTKRKDDLYECKTIISMAKVRMMERDIQRERIFLRAGKKEKDDRIEKTIRMSKLLDRIKKSAHTRMVNSTRPGPRGHARHD